MDTNIDIYIDDNKEIVIPGTDISLKPGYKVKLGRFQTSVWTVGFGWYSVNGNRPVCGWYLIDEHCQVKALQSTDMFDIYVVDICPSIIE